MEESSVKAAACVASEFSVDNPRYRVSTNRKKGIALAISQVVREISPLK